MASSKSTGGWYQYKHGVAKIKTPVPAQIFNARLPLLPKYAGTILFACHTSALTKRQRRRLYITTRWLKKQFYFKHE